jgi:hypothetical protein
MAYEIRVSPDEPHPTHHIQLTDRANRTIGIILCDDKGQPLKQFSKIPVETTAQKQTSGSSSYADYDYPYSPIVQDDLSGGRGSLDFERDSTKYFDSFRTKSGRANKAFAGPQETYVTGLRAGLQSMPGDANSGVTWREMTGDNRYIYKRIQHSAGFTVGLAWLLVRIKGAPANLTIAIHADSAGSVGSEVASVAVPYTRMADVLSEWINETLSQALTGGTYYWLVIHADAGDGSEKHWKVGVKNAVGSYTSSAFSATPGAATFDLYYHLTPAQTEKNCIPFEYLEQQYFVISGESGAPTLWMAGDRGAADANTGTLDRLVDATKSWTANMHAGKIVMVIDGPGKEEEQPWRQVVSNAGTYLVVDANWKIEHTTATVYVILGADVTEITGHGLTAPVTDVQVTTTGIVLFAQGDSVNIRRFREYNNAGAWTREFADDGTNKATFLDYKPQAKKIVKANNADAAGDVSIALADPVAWATAGHTFAAAIPIDSKHRKITGTIVYPDTGGTEALYVFKVDIPFVVPATGNPYPINLAEMRTVRSANNGRASLVHNVYLFFSMQQGLQRYYNGQIDAVGPDLGEGLPSNRRGPIVALQGYPGKYFAAIDAGASGYSSILDSDGWHERYRAPLGQRIKAMSFQVIPGAQVDRLWIYQGNDLLYVPFPSETANELEDAAYPYTPEFAVILSRMHAGIFDVQKIIKKIKLQTEGLEIDSTNGNRVCWFELDYRLNELEEWTPLNDAFTESPTQMVDLTKQLGIAGKRIQFRVRGYTTDCTKTPVLLAIIVGAVIRTDVKYMYPMQLRLVDHEPLLSGRADDPLTAAEKLKIIEDWADSSTDSMLMMRSVSTLFDDKVIFLNPPTTRQILYKGQDGNDFKKDVFICSASMQEA